MLSPPSFHYSEFQIADNIMGKGGLGPWLWYPPPTLAQLKRIALAMAL